MSTESTRNEAVEVVRLLADVAVVAAHYLLDYARKDSDAYRAARMVLNVVDVDVRAVLADEMIAFCPKCGTSGTPAVMESSRRHVRCGDAR